MNQTHLNISTRSFLQFLAILILIGLAYLIRDILVLLFISVILMSAGNPWVDRLEKVKLPRWVAVLIIYLFTLTILGFFLSLIIPPLVNQTNLFIQTLPTLVDQAIQKLNLSDYINRVEIIKILQSLVQNFSSQIAQTPLHLLRFGAGIFGSFLTIISVSVFTFYLMLEQKKVKRIIIFFFPKERATEVSKIIRNVEAKLGAWLRGQLVLSLIIGFLTWLGLTLLQVNFALPLALLAGLLEIIPIIGPITAFVPAFIIAIAISPIKALSVTFLYLFIQQLENNLIVPKVMKETIGMDPLLVILAIMIGIRLAGPLGALLSVPITAVILILASDLLGENSKKRAVAL